MSRKQVKSIPKPKKELTMKDVVTTFIEAGVAVDFSMSRNTVLGRIGKKFAKFMEWADALNNDNASDMESLAFACEGLALEVLGLSQQLRMQAGAMKLMNKEKDKNDA